MPRRTISQATEVLAEMAPVLNPEMYRRYQAQLTEAQNGAKAKAAANVNERYEEKLPVGQEALRDLCTVRDEARALRAEVARGRVTAREASDALEALRRRQGSTALAHADVSRAHEAITAIEADPVAWADSFHTRFPFAMPEFGF